MNPIMQHLTGILLVNLGTPDSFKPKDVYRYLTEFLTDERVIDIPWLSRQLLVRGLIVPSRYKSSAAAYKQIWSKEGSPLMIHGVRVKELLQEKLGDSYSVELAMRYQNPSLEAEIEKILEKRISKLIILPLFPQYASATTGSVFQKVMEILKSRQEFPKLVFINSFFDDSGFINAFCCSAKKHPLETFDRFLFSFHGLPERQLIKANKQYCLKQERCCETLTACNQNCYAAQCFATMRAIAKQLQIPRDKYSICFQSRLGKEPWLQPSTSSTIADCAKRGYKRLLVFCPSFVCDCLETLYEIGIEYAHEFKQAGGKQLSLVEGLNDHPEWIEALKDIVKNL